MWSSGNLSPNPSIQNKSRSPSVTKQSEFFPQKTDTNNAQLELTDDNNNVKNNDSSANLNPASRSQLSAQFLEDRTTKEVRNSLTLALNKKTIDGGYNEANNEDEEAGNQKQSQNSEENAEYDNEDSNRPNVCGFYFIKFYFFYYYYYLFVINNKALHDYQQFNISYEEITDKEMIGRGRFGVVYK